MVEEIINGKVEVFRNDEISMDAVGNYDKIILSPGPGIPQEAGILLPLIKQYAPTKSILGVCLGHQAIGEAFGGTLSNLKQVFHGIATPVYLQEGLVSSKEENDWFKDFDKVMEVGRYHSWVVDEKGFPEMLEITARDEQQMIMSLRHRTYDVQGVQFHPESVLTPMGKNMLANWLKADQEK